MRPNRTLPSTLLAVLAACLVRSPALAEIHEVHPGDEWSALIDRVRPGDEIVLLEGEHVPASFTGLRGEPNRPIVIRPAKPGALASIKPGREAIKFVDCAHVRIERIEVRDARRAGFLVEATAPGGSRDIGFSDVLVVGVKGLAEQAGVVVRDAAEVGVRRSRFENCVGAGILVENSDGVTIEQVQVIARRQSPMQAGIEFAGRCDRPSVLRASISGAVETAFAIGLRAPVQAGAAAQPETAEPETAAPQVRQLTIVDSRSRGSARAIDFGSCEECLVRNSSFIDTREEVHRVSLPPKGHRAGTLRLRDNLVAWSPGVLRRLAFVVDGSDPSHVEFGPNLWWSEELPAALPRLGVEGTVFTGTIATPQTLDLNPVLDNYGYPTADAAKRFGAPKP